jgi:hypothetical protein
MQDNVLIPKYRKNKKPTRVRKPSRPLDGINHRLLREQAAAKIVQIVEAVPDDNAQPTRAELEAKAKELGIKFDGRTGDKKLGQLIQDKLSAGE